MKLFSDFLGVFHVIGTEVIGSTVSSFKNKHSVKCRTRNLLFLFVHSKLGMKYGKKKKSF